VISARKKRTDPTTPYSPAMSLDRLAEPVFRRIAEMCDSTVLTLTKSVAAISLLPSPTRTSASTRFSAAVNSVGETTLRFFTSAASK